MAETILKTEYSEEMQKSYLDYSMSVITSRAVPDIRDGLKPVQRRLLYDMDTLHVNHDRKEMKSARIAGDCMGRFHPHGDGSIYDTMVVMAQDFKRSMPLVDGKGNFGSIEGDGAAAYRYTEAKLRRFTDEVYLRDTDKSVDFIPNYSNTEPEPVVLPVRIPNFLLNGSEGIAVGMITSTPCHNLSELCDLCSAFVDNREMSIDEMLDIMPGPDLPTGGIIGNRSELREIYATGQGRLKLRGRLKYIPAKKRSEKDKLCVTEIPYTMIGAGIGKFMSDTAALVENKLLPEITDIGNATSSDGVNIFLELRKDSDVERISNILYKKTKLEDSFPVNMLAIYDGRPEVMTLPKILRAWLDFQHDILRRKYSALLKKEEEKKEIQEGLIGAVSIIDLVIAVIRGARKRQDAENCLVNGDVSGISFKDKELKEQARSLAFTKRQAEAILEMRLYKLIGLEILELEKEYKKTVRAVKEYKAIVADEKKRDELIKEDLASIKERYGYERRTELCDIEDVVIEEKKIEEQDCVFVTDRLGYCKLIDEQAYEKNKEAVDAENKYVIHAKNTDSILIFTDKGSLHRLKLLTVPAKKPRDKGVPLDNLTKYDTSKEEIMLLCSASDIKDKNLLFATRGGLIKQVPAEEFETNQRTVASTKLDEGDSIVSIEEVSEIGKDTVAVWSEGGYFLRFALDDVPILKKNSKGVKALRLKAGDELSGALIIKEDPVVSFKGREIHLKLLKIGLRGSTGTKQRGA
ncbi:MAG TPA: DNA topoisomerase [Candidatus Avilachnospira avistercoris]|nr:DNA topoisomerase [Candidatus Avilachnospira avistercoris]